MFISCAPCPLESSATFPKSASEGAKQLPSSWPVCRATVDHTGPAAPIESKQKSYVRKAVGHPLPRYVLFLLRPLSERYPYKDSGEHPWGPKPSRTARDLPEAAAQTAREVCIRRGRQFREPSRTFLCSVAKPMSSHGPQASKHAFHPNPALDPEA